MRGSLLGEIVAMAVTTIRTQKMRSALTILGVVIGITSIVGMTSLIRGFDESLRDSIRELGPDTISIMQFGLSSFMAGADFNELLKRPTLTPADARAIERQAESIGRVVLTLGEAGGPRGPHPNPRALQRRADLADDDHRHRLRLSRRVPPRTRGGPLLHRGRSEPPAPGW